MRNYYGLGAVRGSISAPPSPDAPKVLTTTGQIHPAISQIIASRTSTPSILKMGVISGAAQPSVTTQQSIMYQCPNGKLISSPDISLCEESTLVAAATDSGFSKYLLPAGIILAAILLLK